MYILYFSFAYLVVHLSFYIVLGRNFLSLRSESGIFLFHFISFLSLGILCSMMILLFVTKNKFPLFIGVLSLHGIYSLSFLELWSLSQGSYSLSVLRLSPIPLNSHSHAMEKLECIGDVKFAERLLSIQKMGLLQKCGDKVKITRFGAASAAIFFTLIKLTNISDRG